MVPVQLLFQLIPRQHDIPGILNNHLTEGGQAVMMGHPHVWRRTGHTVSPQLLAGSYIGLCFPIRRVLTRVASRPSTCFPKATLSHIQRELFRELCYLTTSIDGVSDYTRCHPTQRYPSYLQRSRAMGITQFGPTKATACAYGLPNPRCFGTLELFWHFCHFSKARQPPCGLKFTVRAGLLWCLFRA